MAWNVDHILFYNHRIRLFFDRDKQQPDFGRYVHYDNTTLQVGSFSGAFDAITDALFVADEIIHHDGTESIAELLSKSRRVTMMEKQQIQHLNRQLETLIPTRRASSVER